MYELATLHNYNVLPIFNRPYIFLQFLKHGGIFIKPDSVRSKVPIIEVVQSNFLEIVRDCTEWSQIKEIKKDKESVAIMREYHSIEKRKAHINESERLKDAIDATIENFEAVIKKHGLQVKRSNRHLLLDAANAAAYGGLIVYATLLGLPPTISFAALIGASVSTAKTFFTWQEHRTITKPSNKEIAIYLSAKKEEMDGRFLEN
jgi:hypothetical protein